MSVQPETNNYEAGIYQLQTTDPVQGGLGGVSNLPLLQLANRTTWLKSRVDGILNGAITLPGYALLNSPVFTGDPRAPTAAAGDNDTSLATTAFVQNRVGGVLSLSIAGTGNITLTAAQAGVGIIILTGALTGARTVIVPTAPTARWIVRNNATGSFSVTVRTASGTGPVVPAGSSVWLYCDGTNVVEVADANISGNAATATALQTARTINGVPFDGSADITLPTVNTTGNQTIAGVKTFTSAPMVPDNSFNFTKLQNIPTATILGRTSAGTGNVEALTGAQARKNLGVTSRSSTYFMGQN